MKVMPRCIALAFGLSLAASGVLAQQQSAPKPATTPAAALPSKPPKSLSVNGKQIPVSRFDFLIKQRAAQGQQAQGPAADSPEYLAAIKEELINRELIMQEAERMGLDKTPDVTTRLELARQQILVQVAVDDYMKKNSIKEDTLKTEYERIKSNLGDKEYKVAHILLEKEEDAKDVIAQLKKGGDFEKIAKDKSKDSGSKGEGGKLDWSNKNNFPPTFGEAMAKLQKGQTALAPIKTPAGFHVIRLDDVRPLKAPTFDEVKENMRRGANQQLLAKMVGELRKNAKIEEKQ